MPDLQTAASGVVLGIPGPMPEAPPKSRLQRALGAAQRFGGPIVVLAFQVLGVLTVTFFLVHLTPGDPAALLAGPYPTEESLAIIRARLGLDRPGLLYDLTRAISDLNLNIASAHIATFGERAVDVFYVTDLIGHKVEAKAREKQIRDRMIRAFDGRPDEAAPVRKAVAG